MTDKDKIKFAIRYLKQELKSKRTPPLYEQLMKELGFENNKSAQELAKENAELKESIDFWEERYWILNDVYVRVANESENKLTKAKNLLAKWVELFKPKGGDISPTPIQVETEQFLKGNT